MIHFELTSHSLLPKILFYLQDKVPMFYDRLYEALEILVEFFNAEHKGLSIESLHSCK